MPKNYGIRSCFQSIRVHIGISHFLGHILPHSYTNNAKDNLGQKDRQDKL